MENGDDITVLSRFLESVITTNNAIISLLYQKGIITKEELDYKINELSELMKSISILSSESARQNKPIDLSNLTKLFEQKIWSRQ